MAHFSFYAQGVCRCPTGSWGIFNRLAAAAAILYIEFDIDTG